MRLLEAACCENDRYPNVLLIEDDLTSEALKALMMAVMRSLRPEVRVWLAAG